MKEPTETKEMVFTEIPLTPFDRPQPSVKYPDNKPRQRSSGSEDNRINNKDIYLADIGDGKLEIGHFYKQWYGWNFNWFWSCVAGIQLDMIARLWVLK